MTSQTVLAVFGHMFSVEVIVCKFAQLKERETVFV